MSNTFTPYMTQLPGPEGSETRLFRPCPSCTQTAEDNYRCFFIDDKVDVSAVLQDLIFNGEMPACGCREDEDWMCGVCSHIDFEVARMYATEVSQRGVVGLNELMGAMGLSGGVQGGGGNDFGQQGEGMTDGAGPSDDSGQLGSRWGLHGQAERCVPVWGGQTQVDGGEQLRASSNGQHPNEEQDQANADQLVGGMEGMEVEGQDQVL